MQDLANYPCSPGYAPHLDIHLVEVALWDRSVWAEGKYGGSKEEHRGNTRPKWTLAREQCGGAVHLKLEDSMYI